MFIWYSPIHTSKCQTSCLAHAYTPPMATENRPTDLPHLGPGRSTSGLLLLLILLPRGQALLFVIHVRARPIGQFIHRDVSQRIVWRG